MTLVVGPPLLNAVVYLAWRLFSWMSDMGLAVTLYNAGPPCWKGLLSILGLSPVLCTLSSAWESTGLGLWHMPWVFANALSQRDSF